MAPQDAEMPSSQPLGEDVQEIAQNIAALRQDLEALSGSLKRAGSHQVEHVQDKAGEAVAALEDAVRRNPVTTLGIALGAGFLFGLILRR